MFEASGISTLDHAPTPVVEVSTTQDSPFGRLSSRMAPLGSPIDGTNTGRQYEIAKLIADEIEQTNWQLETIGMLDAVLERTKATQQDASLKNEIRRYTTLPDGWDGPGSMAPSDTAAHQAIRFMDLLPPDLLSPKTMVEADGEIALYWQAGERYLEIGFKGDGRFSCFGEDTGCGEELMIESEFDGHRIDPDIVTFIRGF